MLNFFSDGELPGDVEGPFASRDVTSFYDIWQAAQNVEATCLMQYGRPGWAAEGGREAVGVFLWATDSLENQRVPQGEPTLAAAISVSGSFFNMSSGSSGSLSDQVLETRRY
ncbi:MAG: hypothetical protein ALECFALPRED_001157 [Alectoria fallacina]|uniref:Uncharacterized protein n=1 Tax=Alectoria fallacina TaxID=1903189 RepID=A0A8H3JAE2_9LECA|nr:MAG: hypothetical protein ALECFALPRED_001157 [Alectoria fallacina]